MTTPRCATTLGFLRHGHEPEVVIGPDMTEVVPPATIQHGLLRTGSNSSGLRG